MTPEYFSTVLSLLADQEIGVKLAEPIPGGYGSPRVDRLHLENSFFGHGTLVAKYVPEAVGREISAYRFFLAPVEGKETEPVATVQAEEGGWWLFLTDFGDETLDRSADLAPWEEAARWLARFQSARLEPPPSRLPIRERFFRWDRNGLRKLLAESADRVRRYRREWNPRHGDELWGSFRTQISRAEKKLKVVPGQFDTRLHGDFKGRNLLVDRLGETIRIHPVDWANAGFGSPFHDLSTLVRDRKEGERAVLVDAYRSQLDALGANPYRGAELDRGLNLFILVNGLLSVGVLSLYLLEGREGEESEDDLGKYLAQVEKAGRTLEEWDS